MAAPVPLLKNRVPAVTGDGDHNGFVFCFQVTEELVAPTEERFCPECHWRLCPPDQPYCDHCMESTGTNHIARIVKTRGYPPQAPLFPDMTLGGDDWQTLTNYQAFGEGDSPRSHVTIPHGSPKSKQQLAHEAYLRRPKAERVAEEAEAYQEFLKRVELKNASVCKETIP